jgi:hypothetical protein
MGPHPGLLIAAILFPGAGRAAGQFIPQAAAAPDLELLPADLAGAGVLDEMVYRLQPRSPSGCEKTLALESVLNAMAGH